MAPPTSPLIRLDAALVMPQPGHAMPVHRAKGQIVGPSSDGAKIDRRATPTRGVMKISRSRHVAAMHSGYAGRLDRAAFGMETESCCSANEESLGVALTALRSVSKYETLCRANEGVAESAHGKFAVVSTGDLAAVDDGDGLGDSAQP